MEWQQLKGFHSAARLGGVTRAARATRRSQSAVSQQIKALEDELGQPLFQRLGRKMLRLTPAGEKLFNFCEVWLQEYEQLKYDLAAGDGTVRGELSLAAPYTSLYQLLPDLITGFSREHPQVKLKILDRPQEEVLKLVQEGQVDFGLALESKIPPGLKIYPWKKVAPRLMLPAGHPLAGAKRLSLKQIAPYPLILPPPGKDREHLERRMAQQNLEYRVVMESSNVELSALYVSKGLGLAFATVVEGAPWLKTKGLSFVPLAGGFPSDHIALLTHGRKRLLPHAEAFLKLFN